MPHADKIVSHVCIYCKFFNHQKVILINTSVPSCEWQSDPYKPHPLYKLQPVLLNIIFDPKEPAHNTITFGHNLQYVKIFTDTKVTIFYGVNLNKQHAFTQKNNSRQDWWVMYMKHHVIYNLELNQTTTCSQRCKYTGESVIDLIYTPVVNHLFHASYCIIKSIKLKSLKYCFHTYQFTYV